MKEVEDRIDGTFIDFIKRKTDRGFTRSDIARELGIDTATLAYWLEKYGVKIINVVLDPQQEVIEIKPRKHVEQSIITRRSDAAKI